MLTETKELRARARKHIEEGAITEDYHADKQTIIDLLNQALATELVCVLRYRRHYFMAAGINAKSVAQEFMEHATQELDHADKIAQRIVQLGGEPDFNPDTLSARSHAEYIPASSLQEMIKEDLIAERIAIESYREMINYIANSDPTTRRLLEEVLAVEEEHAEDLASLSKDIL
jgi:bacterioferritin